MSVKAGSFTPNATGNLSVDGLTFMPTEVQFSLGAETGSGVTSYISHMRGWTTANNQSYDYIFEDGTGKSCRAGTDKCIRHVKRLSGSITDAVAATFVDFHDNGGGNYGFTLNFTAFDSNYQVRYIARD